MKTLALSTLIFAASPIYAQGTCPPETDGNYSPACLAERVDAAYRQGKKDGRDSVMNMSTSEGLYDSTTSIPGSTFSTKQIQDLLAERGLPYVTLRSDDDSSSSFGRQYEEMIVVPGTAGIPADVWNDIWVNQGLRPDSLSVPGENAGTDMPDLIFRPNMQ